MPSRLFFPRRPLFQPFPTRQASSKAWVGRQLRDPFVKDAVKYGYRARSAFKLAELHLKHRLFRPGHVVVDCGAAPGGWSQVAAECLLLQARTVPQKELKTQPNGQQQDPVGDRMTKRGVVIGVDLLQIAPVQGVQFIQGDFGVEVVQRAVIDALGGRNVDVVMSDMAPSFSGQRFADAAKTVELCQSALSFAERVLMPGGVFVCKILAGEDERAFYDLLRMKFLKVTRSYVKASRKTSAEHYMVCKGFGDFRR